MFSAIADEIGFEIIYLILTVLSATAFVAAGCSKEESSAPVTGGSTAPAVSMDTSKLTTAFQSAEPAAKSAVDTAVAAIKKADYSGAVTQLKALSGNTNYKLTDAQVAAVKDAIASVQKAIADLAGKAAGDASKAANDATKALPK